MNNRNPHPSFDLTEADAVYFEKIPAEFLTPLKLLHYEKMSYREIEQQTALPPGTVRSRIHRGREMIRRMRAVDLAKGETWQQPLGQHANA